MPVRFLLAVIALLGLTAWRRAEPDWPVSGPMPDAPGGDRFSYVPVTKGALSFRPVEPLPWGDVNRRVAPTVAPTVTSPPAASPPTSSPDATAKPPETQNAPMQMEHH